MAEPTSLVALWERVRDRLDIVKHFQSPGLMQVNGMESFEDEIDERTSLILLKKNSFLPTFTHLVAAYQFNACRLGKTCKESWYEVSGSSQGVMQGSSGSG